jgi:hypothetical protein
MLESFAKWFSNKNFTAVDKSRLWGAESCWHFICSARQQLADILQIAIGRLQVACFRGATKRDGFLRPTRFLVLNEATQCAIGGRTGAHGVRGFFLDFSCPPDAWDDRQVPKAA